MAQGQGQSTSLEMKHTGFQSLLSLSCYFRRQPHCAGTTDAEAAGTTMSTAWSPSCLVLCPLSCLRDKLWTAQASSTLDGSLPHQESRGACSSLSRKKAMARVIADVVLRSLGGDVDAVTNLKSWFSPVSPIGKQAEALCLAFQICTNPNSPNIKRSGLNYLLAFQGFLLPPSLFQQINSLGIGL